MKSYSVDIQVDFDSPRDMPPRQGSSKPWRAVGYFRYIYCSERSKEKAKKLALDFVIQHEEFPERCQFKCDRIAWMRGLTTREQIAFGSATALTEEMFRKRNDIGVWFDSDKQYYVSEFDSAVSAAEEYEEPEQNS